jgi:uncharacterized short protein YbdD (DUF466 family)
VRHRQPREKRPAWLASTGDDAAAWIRRALRVVRTVIGAPDYERYVDHMHDHHPGCDVVSRDEFMRQRLEHRYSRPGSRCC